MTIRNQENIMKSYATPISKDFTRHHYKIIHSSQNQKTAETIINAISSISRFLPIVI